ncbi:hypothetical protein KOR34_01590 [Posidoniimonas corsicana]|uniref:EF-hand domain-containing protein n=1 Tax=Posidoniimonas corsicana TaxID=1938618 RepID=A0A5C5VAD4_9BACT|nr:BNR-4 repeat-containing protein [Posidoniimonas corsicana]TWT35271.1 hypothetical protein KOR34_01590 [Posidoniimonas corsicana]
MADWLKHLLVTSTFVGVGATAHAQTAVAPGLVEFNDNGAWSWFEDERAVIDAAAGKLLVSSVADGSGPGGAQRNGDVDMVSYDLNSGAVERFVLNHGLQDDDHNSAALYRRSDGRYVAMYGGHLTDNLSRWRVSDQAGQIDSWSSEATFNNGAAMTYSNLHYLPADSQGAGRLYNFVRSVNFDPNILVSDDEGLTWSYGGKLLSEGGSGDRPYVSYASDGNRIHLITTQRHPRNWDNSVFHGYIEDGVLYNSAGAVVDADLLDASAAAPSSLTSVFQTGQSFGGTTMRRGWTVDVAIDAGSPVAVFQARAEDDDRDHRFFYARWDQNEWVVNQMAYAGEHLYAAENDYTGLVAIDPAKPGTVYLSSDVHPGTQARLFGADGEQHYELFRGDTTDNGVTWRWTPLTFNSTEDNVRPIAPQWDAENSAVLWMRGDYNTYQDYNTKVVGLINPEATVKEGGLKVDFGLNGQQTQSGFLEFSRPESTTGPLSAAFDSPLSGSAGGQVEVALSSGQFRDRGDGASGPLADIADDFVFGDSAIDLTLGSLAEGDYQLVLYSHDQDFAQPAFAIGLGGRGLGQIATTTGADQPLGIASSRVTFRSDGAGPVTLSLTSTDGGPVVLNGFELLASSGYDYPPPVDLNGDGQLDFDDYLQLTQELHTLVLDGQPAAADLNGDQRIDFVDFSLFQTAYNNWNGPGALAADTARAAPEPSAAWLTAVTTIGAGAFRATRHRCRFAHRQAIRRQFFLIPTRPASGRW